MTGGDLHRLESDVDRQTDRHRRLAGPVAGQDVEPAEGSDGTDGRWRIARRVAEDRVISTVDPQARHTRKSPEARRDGYRTHLEVEPDTTLITQGAVDHSKRAGQQLLTDATQPGEAYGDSAYGTGERLAALADGEHPAVIKPKPLAPAVKDGFTIDGFTAADLTVDEAAGTVTYPNARVATKAGRRLTLRYHDETKNNAWLQIRIGALNLRRPLSPDLTHNTGTRALA